jgi:hypothetical protein
MKKALAVTVGLAAVAISAVSPGQIQLMNFERAAYVNAWSDHLDGAPTCHLRVKALAGTDWLLGATYGVHFVRFPAVITCS